MTRKKGQIFNLKSGIVKREGLNIKQKQVYLKMIHLMMSFENLLSIKLINERWIFYFVKTKNKSLIITSKQNVCPLSDARFISESLWFEYRFFNIFWINKSPSKYNQIFVSFLKNIYLFMYPSLCFNFPLKSLM